MLTLVEQQIADLAGLHQKRATLTATAAVADGAVQVTVDAQRMVIDTAIDESYFDNFDFVALGAHITAAAQSAAAEIAQRSAELLAPLAERRRRFPSLSGVVDDVPDLSDVLPNLHLLTSADPQQPMAPKSEWASGDDPDWEEPDRHFTVESK